MSVEEILKVIRSHPEAIDEALEKRPELITGLMLRLAPWDRFATKEDVKTLLEFMEKRFEDVNRRFEDVNRRFEDLTRYVDKRVGLVEKLLIGFNVPILIVVITMLIRLFVF
ncbi:MAG: hypothetical protein QXF21_04445 [Thermoproteota archaeon]